MLTFTVLSIDSELEPILAATVERTREIEAEMGTFSVFFPTFIYVCKAISAGLVTLYVILSELCAARICVFEGLCQEYSLGFLVLRAVWVTT